MVINGVNNSLVVKYKQVWHFARGARSLYAWKAIPPEGFVAMGMLCTTTDEPPDVTAMRCVPLKWCSPTKVPPTKARIIYI